MFKVIFHVAFFSIVMDKKQRQENVYVGYLINWFNPI